jgi:hypothetical protein
MSLQQPEPPKTPFPEELSKRVEHITSNVREIASMLEATGEKFAGPFPSAAAPANSKPSGCLLDQLNELSDQVIRLRVAANRIS